MTHVTALTSLTADKDALGRVITDTYVTKDRVRRLLRSLSDSTSYAIEGARKVDTPDGPHRRGYVAIKVGAKELKFQYRHMWTGSDCIYLVPFSSKPLAIITNFIGGTGEDKRYNINEESVFRIAYDKVHIPANNHGHWVNVLAIGF